MHTDNLNSNKYCGSDEQGYVIFHSRLRWPINFLQLDLHCNIVVNFSSVETQNFLLIKKQRYLFESFLGDTEKNVVCGVTKQK